MLIASPPGGGSRKSSPLDGRRTYVFIAIDTKARLVEKKGITTRNFRHLRSTSIYGRDTSPSLDIYDSSSLTAGSSIEVSGQLRASEARVTQLEAYEDHANRGFEESATRSSRVRFHAGYRLWEAKTVNELLNTVYDVLEVHRTTLAQRDSLQRDALVYDPSPVRMMDGRKVDKTSPITIQRILSGENCLVEDRLPTCLVIDYDSLALLDCKPAEPQELMQRTGTPMYIARSMCKGKVLTNPIYRLIPRMPRLSEHARALYTGAHGAQRYKQYNGTDRMPHGARPPNVFGRIKTPPAFRRRPEHDVESIYWSMVAALLRVRPADDKGEPEVCADFAEAWQALLTHRIPKENGGYKDPRILLLCQEEADWPKLFIGDMNRLGPLLYDISLHVRPEYALCGEGLRQAHLHEAIQRLILQYLVDHDDIPLDPYCLRHIPQPQA